MLIVRDVCAGNDSIGPHRHDNVQQPGQMVSHALDESDNPPMHDKKMPTCDEHGVEKNYDVGIKGLRESLKNAGHDASGNAADLRRRCKNYVPPMPTKKTRKKPLKGCVGMTIGLMEVLCGRDTLMSMLNYQLMLRLGK